MRMVRIQAHVQIAWHASRDPDGCVYVYVRVRYGILVNQVSREPRFAHAPRL